MTKRQKIEAPDGPQPKTLGTQSAAQLASRFMNRMDLQGLGASKHNFGNEMVSTLSDTMN